MATKPPTVGQRSPTSRRGGSAHLRDQSAAYAAVRASLLDAEPLCRYHRDRGEIVGATVVDHIVALSLGGSNDRSNLAPACRDCNDRKSAVERRFARRGYDVADIMLDPDLAGWIKQGRSIINYSK